MMALPPDDSSRDGVNLTNSSGPTVNVSPVVEGKEVCPLCGRVLRSQRCKLVCECGYFMSCSEF